MFVILQVNGIKVSKARVLEARKGTKPIVGRDWLTTLRYKNVHATEEGDTAKATQTPREKILTRLKDSMLKVENVKERKVQASDEKQDTRQPIKLKHGRVKNNATEISEQESKVNFSTSDFEEEIDSTILVRERTRGSKLEPTFTKKRGRILEETDLTISFLPQGKKRATKLAKRDVARANSPPEDEIKTKKGLEPEKTAETSVEEEMSDEEPPFRRSNESSEITPIETNLESEQEVSSEEASIFVDEKPCCSKTEQKEIENKTNPKAKKAKVEKPAETRVLREEQNDADALPNAMALM